MILWGDLATTPPSGKYVCEKPSGKSIFKFRSMSKGIQKMQKIETEQKKYQKMVWPSHPLESICFISSTSMQKEKFISEFCSPDKKFVAQNTNLRNGVITSWCNHLCSWCLVIFDILTSFRLVPKEIQFRNFRGNGHPKDAKKIATDKKIPKNGLTEPPFTEFMFIWLVQHPCKSKIQ